MTTHPACGKSWTGSRIEHCAACCESFSGTRAGDMHRVGDYSDGTRRCLTPDEMRERGLRLKNGVWGRSDPDRPHPHSEAAKSTRRQHGEASQ